MKRRRNGDNDDNEDFQRDDTDSYMQDAAMAAAQTDLESALPPVDASIEALGTDDQPMSSGKWAKGQSSIYVDAFNLALDTVLDEERHLFDDTEMAVFSHWRTLGYGAQYLYVRLFLRKTSAWHRVGGLGYNADVAHMGAAIDTLQRARCLPGSGLPLKQAPVRVQPASDAAWGATFSFADSSEDCIHTLDEASSLLRLDELKALAKHAKVQGRNKQELLGSFRRASRNQPSLHWRGLKKSASNASVKQAREPATSVSNDAHWIQAILSQTGPCIRLSSPALKLFERVHLVFYRSAEWTEKSLTSIILAKTMRRDFPEYIVSRSAKVFASRALLLEFEAALRTQFRVDSILEFNGGTTGAEELRVVLDLSEEIYPRWLTLLREEQAKEDSIYISGEGAYLRRLSPAWVYTRIVHKGAFVLGKLKQHKREHKLLVELLGQRLFHTSRRGAWCQRKALLEEHYMAALMSPDAVLDRRHSKQVALKTCEEGLQDTLVHQIYHYDLQKRITKLERALRVPKRLQHTFGHVRLAAPTEVTIEGIRLDREATPNVHARGGSQRTVWLDERDAERECSVEAMCLSHYRSQGWKGYHSEGGIVRTLFALLFYDVLFAYVPDVFQTPFQTCPLDLHTDTFYPARLSEINARLAQIANGHAEQLVRAVWDAHAARRTCVVGLDWAFARDDLLEVARCFDGPALAAVCAVLAQDYGQRGAGVPDLFLWHPAERTVMFAEVKSENDRLSDAQRLWIHVLTGAGVSVQLCKAVAREVRTRSAP